MRGGRSAEGGEGESMRTAYDLLYISWWPPARHTRDTAAAGGGRGARAARGRGARRERDALFLVATLLYV